MSSPSSGGLDAMKLRDISLDAWQEWVESRPEAVAFHHRAWIELLMEEYGLAARVVALTDGDGVVAAAPFLATPRLTGGKKLISLPFSDCVPPLSRHEHGSCALFLRLHDEDLSGWRSVVVRTDGPCPPLASEAWWVRHAIDLRDGFDRAGLPPALRRNLNRAAGSGLEFSVRSDLEAVDAFYDLHVLTRRKLGVPVQRRRFFRTLHRKILKPGLGFIGLVTKDDRALAAGVFLGFGPTLIYKFGASDPSSLRLRPNELLFAGVLGLAVERGYAGFDFGVSRIDDEGLRRFKLKWQSRELPVHHVILRGKATGLAHARGLQRIAGAVIRRSPTIVSRAIGGLFYRYAS